MSFSIRPGEVLGVIGPNGSGKTTLFECMGGVLAADAGAVLRDARPLTTAEQKAAIFYLPDLIAPWPSQSVRWALDFVTGYWGRTRVRPVSDRGRTRARQVSDTCQTRVGHVSDPSDASDADGEGKTAENPANRVANVVAKLDLGPLLDQRIGALSKGQRKRALLAFGLLTPQPVLLADEPFDGLDLRQTRDVAATLRDYASHGRTLVLSIHQIADAARVCDRFVLLSNGRIRGEGTLDELASLAAAHGSTNTRNLEDIFLALT